MSVVKTPRMCSLCVAYDRGECRLSPPVVVGFSVPTASKEPPTPIFGFPAVQGTHWCLQFQAAPGLEPEKK